jgi:sirohydrochlorin ferrochelatase
MDHIGVGIIVPLVLVWGWWTTISLDRRLRSMERNVSALLRHFNVDPTVLASPSEQVKLLAADPARRVEAIRVYRQETGADLMSAKVIVDELAKSS